MISWNIWCKNKEQASSIRELIQSCNPDIICLQEVSQEGLDYIQSLDDYHHIHAIDYVSHKSGQKKEYYLVILSKHTIDNTHKNKESVRHITQPSLWDKINRWEESMEFQYADICYENIHYRIFNIHLEISAGPKTRLAQFDQIIPLLDPSKVSLVAGDFNIFARWFIGIPFGWLFGFSLQEAMVHERKIFEQHFEDLGFCNIFRQKITYPRYRLQLDHILTPKDLDVRQYNVIKDMKKSDHHPISIEW